MQVLANAPALDNYYPPVLGLLLDGEALVRTHHSDDTQGHDGEPSLLGQQSRRSVSLVPAVADVRLALPIDHERVATHPD